MRSERYTEKCNTEKCNTKKRNLKNVTSKNATCTKTQYVQKCNTKKSKNQMHYYTGVYYVLCCARAAALV